MDRRDVPAPPRDPFSWAWLALALPLLYLSAGGTMVPVAAWLAPLFLLRFARTRRPVGGLIAAWAATTAMYLPAWAGMIPVPGALYALLAATYAALYVLPFVIDRLVAPRLPGLLSTLVLPTAWVAIEWLNSVLSPHGSWGSVAYTQSGDLPLLQILSITGLWGVSFLIGWFAATASWAWERRFEWKRVREGVLLYAAVLGLVLLFGGLRLAAFPPRAPTVRVAGITVHPGPAAWKIMRVLEPGAGRADIEPVRLATRALHDTLLARSQREARAGARIVLWSEANGLVLKQDEAGLIQRGRELARRERIWLLMALATATPGRPAYENQLIAVGPDGAVACRYHKARPVPGDRETGADPRIPVPLESRYGRLGAAICFDMDFPPLIRSAGRERADILFVPASDWAAIDPIHTRMAICRGIENGCAVVRQTHQGLSVAADHQGRVLAAADYFRTADPVLVAQVPTRGAHTLYARVGDLFAWACCGALIALVVLAAISPKPRG
jgi:apolipoprotein N-acyltransferase